MSEEKNEKEELQKITFRIDNITLKELEEIEKETPLRIRGKRSKLIREMISYCYQNKLEFFRTKSDIV